MRRVLLAIVAVVIVFCVPVSCRKEIFKADLSGFEGKYLVCDSIKTTVNGRQSLVVKGRATGFDLKFNSKRSLTLFSNPPAEYQYKVRYAKLYYWPETISKHEGDYYNILNYTTSKLILEYRNFYSGDLITYYYTAD